MSRRDTHLQITAEQREQLIEWSKSETLPARQAFHAKLILALADGMTYREIMQLLGTTGATISQWRRRFEQDSLTGLLGRNRGGEPRKLSLDLQTLIIKRALDLQSSLASRYGSCRTLAKEFGVGKSTVHRLLVQGKVKRPDHK